MRHVALSIILVMLACPAFAGEVSMLGGYGWTNNPLQKTYAWQAQYMEGLGEHFAYSLSYLNQGHFPVHHRDAHAANLWVRQNFFDRHLSLGVGGGGVFYYDTTHPPPGIPSADIHGWGTMASVAATWYTDSRLLFQLQGYWVRGGQSFDTLSVLAGIGYQLDPPPTPGPDVKGTHQPETTTDNEVTVFGGETTVNIPGDGHSTAAAIEYRRGIWRYLEWTVGGLYEGKSTLINRYGLTTQLWLSKLFLHDHLSLGFGGGGYFAVDQRSDPQLQRSSGVFASEIVTLTGAVLITPHWAVRASWDRIITNYDRDSDVFLGGIGYRF
ncbi:MAG TPA: hypothetical protein VI298_05770 [Geobacteraceae bacterium]